MALQPVPPVIPSDGHRLNGGHVLEAEPVLARYALDRFSVPLKDRLAVRVFAGGANVMRWLSKRVAILKAIEKVAGRRPVEFVTLKIAVYGLHLQCRLLQHLKLGIQAYLRRLRLDELPKQVGDELLFLETRKRLLALERRLDGPAYVYGGLESCHSFLCEGYDVLQEFVHEIEALAELWKPQPSETGTNVH